MADRVRETHFVARVLLVCTLAELVLLGSGRLLQVGPLTVRMGLFGVGIAYAAFQIYWARRLDVELGILLLAFSTVTLFGVIVGLLGGAPVEQVGEDVKPLSFFFSLAFFWAAVRTLADVERVAAVIRRCSLVLAVGYLAFLAGLFVGVIPFGPVYDRLNATGEFFFRGESGFFYKGFVYLGVGIFFFALRPGIAPKVAAAVLFAALAATLTRGMLLSTAVVLALALMLRQRNALVSATVPLAIVAASLAVWSRIAAAFADRGASDALRLNDVRNVIEGTTWWSVVVGHGLGTAIGVRDRIEATYLEFLFKQGVVGLAFWALVFALLVRDFLRAGRVGQRDRAEPFFLGSVFLFLQSATNPFLTNPIGMSLVLVSLVALRVLAAHPAEPRARPELALVPRTPTRAAA